MLQKLYICYEKISHTHNFFRQMIFQIFYFAKYNKNYFKTATEIILRIKKTLPTEKNVAFGKHNHKKSSLSKINEAKQISPDHQ